MIITDLPNLHLQPQPLSAVLTSIKEMETSVLKAIREYVANMTDQWARVPGLAWQIVRRTDDENTAQHFRLICELGLYPICTSDPFEIFAQMWVNCANGTLVEGMNPRTLAPDQKVRTIYPHLHYIEPRLVTANLQKIIDDSSSGEQLLISPFKWVRDLESKGGVPASFKRREPLPEEIDDALI